MPSMRFKDTQDGFEELTQKQKMIPKNDNFFASEIEASNLDMVHMQFNKKVSKGNESDGVQQIQKEVIYETPKLGFPIFTKKQEKRKHCSNIEPQKYKGPINQKKSKLGFSE